MLSKNYIYYYGHVSHPSVLNFFKNVGGRVIKESKLEKKGITITAYTFVADARKMLGSGNKGYL